ncbi:hypothetical protein [Streptomyces sp. NBC_00347]|uniref:hypothetical protein n=1 Tax=Streptomyces sp. NBC_00347 TaxID=2975721 RepID=UPI002259DAE9|nr:hypothetical protein [Streptomyces sp. NBC_00347]MCX5130070.1 hypothetical protein [Streptomyces sp. NBC_00347]
MPGRHTTDFTTARDLLGKLAAGNRAVATAFELSYRDLPADQQLLFRRLGLHPGPDTDAADAGTDAYEEAAGTSAVAGAPSGTSAAPLGDEAPLLPESEAEGFRDQWARIQGGFVDDPRESVREADALVASVMQHLAGTFADRKGALEEQWQSGGEVATEDLRLALQRYRSFFNRLLTT